MSSKPAPDLLLAERYRLKSQIGEGGIGQVWLAEDIEQNNQPVAVKLPRPEYIQQATFVAEAERMIQLQHENIIKIYTMGRHETFGEYYVMEYFPDGSLIDFMESPRCKFTQTAAGLPDLRFVSLKQAINILRPVARALDYVHQHHPGVLHRDLKLSNILVDQRNDRYVLTDFSLNIGAPSIMSPEQLLSWKGPSHSRQVLDWRSDLYSFGACLYKLMTGSYPFSLAMASNTNQAIDEIYRYQLVDKVPVDFPHDRNPANRDLHNDRINDIIWQLTSKSRTGRTLNGQIRKMEDVLNLLETATIGKKSIVTPMVAILVLAVALGLLAAGILLSSAQPIQGEQPTMQVILGPTQVVDFTTREALTGYPTETPTVTPPPTQTPANTPSATPTEPAPAETPTPEPEAVVEAPAPASPAPAPSDLQCDLGLELLNPPANQPVSGQVVFQGVISQDNLDYYKIEFLPPDSSQWSCCLVDPTQEGQVNPNALGQWDTAAAQFEPGEYGIRLVAVKLDGNFNICESRVTLQK